MDVDQGDELFALPTAPNVVVLELSKKVRAPEGDYARGKADTVKFYDPLTWTSYIEAGDTFISKRLIIQELREYFSVLPRQSIPRGADPSLYDKAVYLETVEAWLTFVMSIRSWRNEAVISMVTPSLTRLMDFKVRDEKGGAKAVRQFRSDIDEDLNKNDPIGKAFARSSKNDPLPRKSSGEA